MKRWTDISPNPDDPRVLQWRQQRVIDTQLSSVPTLSDYISSELSGLRVLDFGYANHAPDTTNMAQTSTHSLVVSAAADVVAVDVVPDGTQEVPGVSYVCADLLQLGANPATAVGAPFDAIFAGAVLEHLPCPSRLMEVAAELLNDSREAKLVITVPNPLWLIGLYDMTYPSRHGSSLNVDHVGLQYAGILAEIAERGGMELLEWRYVGRGDMVPRFAPGRGFRKLGWAAAYAWARHRDLPFAHNSIGAVLGRSGH